MQTAIPSAILARYRRLLPVLVQGVRAPSRAFGTEAPTLSFQLLSTVMFCQSGRRTPQVKASLVLTAEVCLPGWAAPRPPRRTRTRTRSCRSRRSPRRTGRRRCNPSRGCAARSRAARWRSSPGFHSTLVITPTWYVPNARGWNAYCTPYVQHVRPWAQAALCPRYVPNAGGRYA